MCVFRYYFIVYSDNLNINFSNVYVAGDPFCPADIIWPMTKGAETATTTCSATGRVGTQERYCNGTIWADPIDLCTKASLSALLSVTSVRQNIYYIMVYTYIYIYSLYVF